MSTRALAPAFTLAGARKSGLSKDRVYSLIEQGEIERAGRGVYIRPDTIDPAFTALAATTAIRDDATLCLSSALVHHDLCDDIPFAADIALPRGVHHPAGISHVNWHSFDPETYQIGRQRIKIDTGFDVAIYSAERTIVDCFRLMHQEGNELAYQALRRWLRMPGTSPALLVKTAWSFPKALPRIRQALDILL